MSEEIDSLKEAEKKAESSNGYEETIHTSSHSRPSFHRGSNWGSGVALIVIGVIFLVANTTNFHLHNWWALFILIPAFCFAQEVDKPTIGHNLWFSPSFGFSLGIPTSGFFADF